jgi:hypothetical protein
MASDKAWQLQHRLGVARRKAAVGRLAPRQPDEPQVFPRVQQHRRTGRHGQAEDVLGVAGHARRIAITPDRVDVVDIGQLPVAQRRGRYRTAANLDAGLLEHLTPAGLDQRFVGLVLRTRHALPVARFVGALDQQHVERRGVNHHQDRFGDLVQRHRQ